MSNQQRDTSSQHRLLLLLSIFAVAFLYIYRISDKALDFDEQYSMNIATGAGGSTLGYARFGQFVANPITGPSFSSADYKARCKLSNVVSTAMNDNGQGLPYFIMLHAWLKLFGISGFLARLPSALFMIVSLLMFYRLLRRWQISPALSLTAMLLFACNGVVIGLAQYVRFYSLGVLLTVISTHVLWSLCERPRKKWLPVILGLIWGIMLLNQFFAVFVIAAQGLYMLRVYWKRKPVQILLPIMCGLLVPVAIWLIPLGGWESLRNIYSLHRDEHFAIARMTMPAGVVNTPLALITTLVGAIGQPVSTIGSAHSLLLQILPGLPSLLLIGLVIIMPKKPVPLWVKLCVMALLIYVLASVVHSTITGYTLLFQGRYWVFAYVFSYALLSWALAYGLSKTPTLKWLAVLVLCLSCGRAFYTSASVASGWSLGSNGRLVPAYVQPFEDYEGLAATIVAHRGDTVSYKSWRIAQQINWFLLEHPDLVQRVDSMQPVVVMLCNGPIRQVPAMGRGRTKTAWPVWWLKDIN